MADHNELGKDGEDLAVEYLQLKEYEILERNYSYQKAEIDIIAKRNSILIAVEVKTRSTPAFGNPQEFVKPKQIRQMVKAINSYIDDNSIEAEVRFDIIAIVKNSKGTQVEHIQNAFLYF